MLTQRNHNTKRNPYFVDKKAKLGRYENQVVLVHSGQSKRQYTCMAC